MKITDWYDTVKLWQERVSVKPTTNTCIKKARLEGAKAMQDAAQSIARSIGPTVFGSIVIDKSHLTGDAIGGLDPQQVINESLKSWLK